MLKVNFAILVYQEWMAVQYTYNRHIFSKNEINKTQSILSLLSALFPRSMDKSCVEVGIQGVKKLGFSFRWVWSGSLGILEYR